MGDFCDEFSNEELRLIENEFQRVEENKVCYLDHAGTTLYSEKQIEFAHDVLKKNLFCNPHSCKITEDFVDQVRFRVLKHFNTNSTKYDCVFTSSATAALKTVAECFEFKGKGFFGYCQENHTSVLGLREIVNTKDIRVLTREELLRNIPENQQKHNYLAENTTTDVCNNDSNDDNNPNGNCLVTFSAQCNFSGYKFPLELIEIIQKSGLVENGTRIKGTIENSNGSVDIGSDKNNFYVCLDAASYVATNFLDLNRYNPDYVCISFYKMFGYPTGLGALLVSKRGQSQLHKKYFGGGTVNMAISGMDFHVKRNVFHERFEDGTLSFLSIASLLEGFKTIERLIPPKGCKNSMERTSLHVFKLAQYCSSKLKELTYKSGKPLIKLYSHTNYIDNIGQGGIVTFNLLHEDGSFVGFAEVACLASIYNIILRTGCFCNTGACQALLGIGNEDLKKQFEAGHVCGDYNDLIDGFPTGAARVSFGYMTRKEDVDYFLKMIKECYLKTNDRLEIIEKSSLPPKLKNVPLQLRQQKERKEQIRLREICIYPIKSCGPFKIKGKWELTENGLKYDRCWMIVNSNGMAITQKNDTRLCLIRPTIDLNSGLITLHYPERESINIPLNEKDYFKTSLKTLNATICQSKVCGDFIEGIDCGDEISNWINDCFSSEDRGLRLIRQRTDVERVNQVGVAKEINLSNQAQFLVINRTSIEWLTSQIENWEDLNDNENILDSVTDRFRGNLIIETKKSLEENDFSELRIIGSESNENSNYTLKVDGFCTRCQMICIDQSTGEKTSEPLRTIARVFKGKIRFGIYLSQSKGNKYPLFISCDDKISPIRK